ncbi:MAG TPA: PqqD family protein [Actinomycetota bacterium]|nr:PqqD family protein [Actinomycetota bacterium]
MTRLARSSSIPWRRIGDDVILAPAGRDDFDQLSGTAAVVWSFLETPCSPEDLVSELAETYAVPPEGIGSDVRALVSDLIERGAVEELAEADD